MNPIATPQPIGTVVIVLQKQKVLLGELKTMEPTKCEGWEWIDLKSLPENILPGHLAAIELATTLDDGLKEI